MNSRSLIAGAKILSHNDNFYCGICAPPAICAEDEDDIDLPSDDNAVNKLNGDSIIKSTAAPSMTKSKPPKPEVTQSSPRKLANLFRSRKNNTLPPPTSLNNKSLQRRPQSNGTGELTINVGENDLTSKYGK